MKVAKLIEILQTMKPQDDVELVDVEEELGLYISAIEVLPTPDSEVDAVVIYGSKWEDNALKD